MTSYGIQTSDSTFVKNMRWNSSEYILNTYKICLVRWLLNCVAVLTADSWYVASSATQLPPLLARFHENDRLTKVAADSPRTANIAVCTRPVELDPSRGVANAMEVANYMLHVHAPFTDVLWTSSFLPRDAMHPRYKPWACVRVCVCLSQVGVLLKRLDVGSHK